MKIVAPIETGTMQELIDWLAIGEKYLPTITLRVGGLAREHLVEFELRLRQLYRIDVLNDGGESGDAMLTFYPLAQSFAPRS